MSYKEDLEIIEQKVTSNKEQHVRLQERQKNLSEEKTKILKELEEMNITADKLEDTIVKLEAEIMEKITKCQQILQ